MPQCAIHRVFFMSTVVLWLFATMYLLRTGTGNISTKKTFDIQSSLSLMEELERQNAQLKEIASKLNLVEVKSNEDARSMEKERNGTLIHLIRSQLDKCRKKNDQLTKDIDTMKIEKEKYGIAAIADMESSDELTRSAHNNIMELWYSIKSKLTRLQDDDSLSARLVQQVKDVIEDIRMQKSSALVEVELLQDLQLEIQVKEMKALQELVQKRIRYVQNPEDCENARKLVCNINKGCGFGCQLHHVVYCFLVAFGTERTLILESTNWRYSPQGWESVFLPLSKTCTTAGPVRKQWNGEELTKNEKIVALSSVDSMSKRPPYLPLNIPEDLAPKLIRHHGNPAVWWIGQFVMYLVRPQPWLKEAVKEFENKIGFKHPVTGIHVRRTDKIGTEAAFHSISEYMDHVVDWFDKEDMRRQRSGKPKIEFRRVYVASDDPLVISQAAKNYPTYEFLGDAEISKSAGTSERYSKSSLKGLLFDIFLLGKADFIVGTFSSQVSRVGYELMQTLHPDAAEYAHSLDDIFYFGGQSGHSQKILYDHSPDVSGKYTQVEMKAGDMVGIAGNHWNGYSKGIVRRTGRNGLYPSYKAKEVITTAKFPTYPKAETIKLEEDYDIK